MFKTTFLFLNNFEILKIGNIQGIYNLKNEVVNISFALFFPFNFPHSF